MENQPSRVAPNPHSPYASAAPDVRHIFPSLLFFPAPAPGGLAPAACDLMAVVPDELIETQPGAALPDGLCPDCVTVMQGGRPPKHPSSECGDCGAPTWHGVLCALCRQEKHDEWWPTRTEQPPVEAPADESTVGPRCGNNPNARLAPGDRQAVKEFREYLARRRAGGPPERNPFTTSEEG